MMYDGGRSHGILGQLYFVVILLLGWLILINLFVSILLVGVRVRGAHCATFSCFSLRLLSCVHGIVCVL